LFYLETLRDLGKIDSANPDLIFFRDRAKKTVELACLVDEIFGRKNVAYAFMKTLRPFPYSGADVDVIVESREGFSTAEKALREQGFQLLGHDLYSATLFRGDFGLNVDLQLELSVSGLPYVRKDLLLSHKLDYEVNGTSVKTLNPASEIVVAACHAFYKEHMYMLSDFYTTALHLKADNSQELCRLAEEANCVGAVTSLFKWMQRVANQVCNVKMQNVALALEGLKAWSGGSILDKKGLDFPFKFPLSFIALSLTHKMLIDECARSSLPRAVYSSFSTTQLRALISHFGRESY
jgi:hypothetical protein